VLAGALFDPDGTLVDTVAICSLAFRRAVERSTPAEFSSMASLLLTLAFP